MILSACIIWKTCLKLIELNPSNLESLKENNFFNAWGGGGGMGGGWLKILGGSHGFRGNGGEISRR